MTPSQKAAMQAALDDLVLLGRMANIDHTERPAIKALRAALAEPVGEPVAYRSLLASGSYTYCITKCFFDNAEPLYTAPQAQQPAEVPLLDDMRILSLWHETSSVVPHCNHYNHFARAIEALVRQKAGLK